MEIEKITIYGLKKTKYMTINTGKEPEELEDKGTRRQIKRRNSSRNRYLQVPRNGYQQIRELQRSYNSVK